MMTKSYSGLARAGLALLPWLPGAIICMFWRQYFKAQVEFADSLDIANGSAALSSEPGRLASSSHPHTVVIILGGVAFAFVLGLALLTIAFLRRRRSPPFRPDA